MNQVVFPMLTAEPVHKGKPLLTVSDLRIEARLADGWSEIVKGISLELRRGEVLGLVGESGAGKSTVGLAALGYVRQGCRIQSGNVTFDGLDLRALSKTGIRSLRGVRIAYVAQSAAASFNPSMRLMDQIVEAAVSRGGQSRAEAESHARKLFAAMQLPDPDKFGARYPHQVSGGQLQRAMVVMAMICRPDLIVFDEPTTALDVTTQVEVLVSIRKAIKQFGVAALYITHDLAIVAQMADRIMVLRYGEVVEVGDVATMLDDPKEAYTKSLWAVRNIPTATRAASPGLLQINGLDAHYGTFQALQDITLDVGYGRTVAIVGESGSGKSTLGRIVAGLMAPSSGSLSFQGKTCPPLVRQRSKDMLQRIQIIYQSADNALNPHHTVRKIIGRPLKLYHKLSRAERSQRIVDLLQSVELDASYIDRRPQQLSGGQRQRIAIARALAANPELIICDEITSALDQVVQAEILKMLISLQQRLGVSYIFITHDLATVRAIADDVVVMHQGKIVEQGPRDAVLAPPYKPYTQLLLASVPEMTTGWLDKVIAQRQLAAAAHS